MADKIKKILEIGIDDNASAGINKIDNNLEQVDDNLKKVAQSTDNLTSSQSSNTQGVLDNGGAMGILNTLTNGYAQILKDSVEASALFGKEGKILTGIQTVYAGVVGTSTGAMKGFRIALALTGVGLLVIGLGLLIANFDKVTAFVSKSIDKFKGLGEGTKFLISVMFPLIGVIRGVVSALEFFGIIDDDITKQAAINAEKRIKALNKEEQSITEKYDSEIRLAKAAGKSTVQLEKAKRDAILLTLQSLNDAERARIKSGEATEEEITRWNDRQKQIKGIVLDGKVANVEIETDRVNRLAAIQKKADEDAVKARDKFNAEAKKAREDEAKRQFDAAVAGADAGRKFEDEQKEKAKENRVIEEEEEQERLDSIVAKDTKVFFDKRKQDEEDLAFQIRKDEAIAGSQQNLSNIINNIQSTNLAKTKTGQAISKAIALTQIGIDSAVAISKASTLANAEGVAAQLAFPLLPGAGTVARVISYASTATQVVSNISRAKSLLSGGGGTGGGLGGSGGGTGGGRGSAPEASFNIVGQSTSNQLAQSLNNRENRPVNAYVIGSDVSSQQQLDRNRIRNSTFLD